MNKLLDKLKSKLDMDQLVWSLALSAALILLCPMPRDVSPLIAVLFAVVIIAVSYIAAKYFFSYHGGDDSWQTISHAANKMRKIPKDTIIRIASPVWIFFSAECIVGDYAQIDIAHRLMNVALLLLVYKVIAIIMRNIPLSLLIGNLGIMIFYISSYFITIYRSRPITPWDFFGIGTVLDVTPHYSFSLTIGMIIGLIICFVFYLMLKMVPKTKKKISKYYLVYPLMIVMLLVFSHNEGYYHITDTSLINTYQKEGTALSFVGMSRQYILTQPKRPEGYSAKAIKKYKKKLTKTANLEYENRSSRPGSGIQPQNIIVVMNESFADMNVGGTNVADNMIPYYSNLKNTVRGELFVSVRGGGTCNTEYEALTGNTAAFFPAGVYPFSKYMNRDVPSLASYFADLGYNTTGMHLGNPKNWNRQEAYTKMGFRKGIFAESFDGLDTLHGYPTDEEHFKRIISICDKNKKEKNFIFNVTFQNHGDYADTDDLEKTVDLSYYGDLPKAENYFSLIKVSDRQFKELVSHFKKAKEPTMIVMFGDHQPSLGPESDELLFPGGDSEEEQMKKYETPFLIWTNYDIPDRNVGKMSVNYLSSMILKTGNFRLTPYQYFLYELWKKYPVITMVGCYDKDDNYFRSASKIKSGLLNEYRCLQYNNVFDRHRDDSLFELKH